MHQWGIKEPMDVAANENNATPEQLIETQSLATVAAYAALRLPSLVPVETQGRADVLTVRPTKAA
jgi:hypothetical protein